jgi:hypothetical protein
LDNQTEARKLTELPDEFKDLTANDTNLDLLKEKARYFVSVSFRKYIYKFSFFFLMDFIF